MRLNKHHSLHCDNFLASHFGIESNIRRLAEIAERDITEYIENADVISGYNQLKVLAAMKEAGLSDYHFAASTGYGYGDSGRNTLEDIYSKVFNTEAALVRSQIISGTHAITLCLLGVLKPGDELLSITGAPYDTLQQVISGKNCGSLEDYNISYSQVDLLEDGKPNYDGILKRIKSYPPTMVLIQRSRGYSLRPSFTVEEIEKLIYAVKDINDDIVCFVDNCYGEFVQTREPTEVGADLCAGSLIKNLGGGISLGGGYVTGRKDLVDKCFYRLTVPGLDTDSGPSLVTHRLNFQGLFFAPLIVGEALKGSIFTSKFLELAGFEVDPRFDENRADIVTAAILGDKEKLVKFCEGIQGVGPIDANVLPIPWAMPGYDSEVIMAAGCFVQGSSIELTADAPLRSPYAVYIQGGLNYTHVKLGVMNAIQKLVNNGYVIQ